MGLFGPRKLCPVCGKPASRFLPTKVEGQPLCGDCDSKVLELPDDLRGSVIADMESLRAYLAVFDENQALRDSFQTSYQHDFGIFSGSICLDTAHRLLRLSSADNAFVFEPQNILSFCISEDDFHLFEGTKDALVCYQSAIPDRVRGMDLQLDRFRMERMQCEQMRRMEEEMERRAKERGETYYSRYISVPSAGDLNPFRKYHVYLELDHPYRKMKKEFKKDAPGFSDYDLSVKAYLRDYEAAAQEMRALADNLMAVINPDAPERQVSAPAQAGPGDQAAAPADPVAEIQRYKALLDSGAITEEEFAAKKRQLLGI